MAFELPAASDPQRWRVIIAGLSALVLSLGVARFSYTPLLPVMVQQAGMSELVAGWMATFIYLGYTAGTLLATMTRSLLLKFYLYRLCLVLAVVCTLAMAFTDNVWIWYTTRLVGGFSGIAGLILASGLALDWLLRTGRQPELGLHFTGAGLGIMVTGVVTALAADSLDWQQQWLTLGLTGLLFLLPAWCWMPAPDASAHKHRAAREPMDREARRWLRLMLQAYFCGGCGYVMGATFIVDILERLPALASAGAWCWVIVGVAAAPSTFLWDRAARRIGAVNALILAYGLQAISMLLPAVTSSPSLNLFSGVLWGGTFIGIVNLTLTLVGRRFPHNPASAMAGITLGYAVSQMMAPALTGYALSLTGEYRLSMLAATVVMLVGAAILWRIRTAPA